MMSPPPTTTTSQPPSSCMTTAQYMRAHLNAPPSKLRSFIKHQIFVHDDVGYLKKLVKDIGGFDYVFRFLWFDGPVPAANDTSSASVGVATGSTDDTDESSIGSNPCCETKNKRVGRTWIQYCCYWNAHKCLLWIFDEIIRNHLQKQKKHFYLKVGGWEYWKTLAGPRAF